MSEPFRWKQAVLATVCLGAGALAAPAPWAVPLPGESLHTFTPVSKDWVVATSWLKPELDPPVSYTMIADKDRDPNYKDYLREDRFFVHKGDKQPCKILRYWPSGALEEEIDDLIEGDSVHEQFIRSYYSDGWLSYFMHWKDGKWLDGGSISPDGRLMGRLENGDGSMRWYGARADTYTHAWYSKGYPFLEKRYQLGMCIGADLNDGPDRFTAAPAEETLRRMELREIWTRPTGHEARFSVISDDPPGVDTRGDSAQAEPRREEEYPRRRVEFMKSYGKRLEKAGRTWEDLGIDFLRDDAGWPKR